MFKLEQKYSRKPVVSKTEKIFAMEAKKHKKILPKKHEFLYIDFM